MAGRPPGGSHGAHLYWDPLSNFLIWRTAAVLPYETTAAGWLLQFGFGSPRRDGLPPPSHLWPNSVVGAGRKREWDRVQDVYDEWCRGAGSNSRFKVVIAPAPSFSIKSSVCFLAWQHGLLAVLCPDNFPSPGCGDRCAQQRVSGPTRESSLVDISLHLKQFEAGCTLGNNSDTGCEV